MYKAMNIKIEVSANASDINQAEQHRIKRVANVLSEAGHKVTIVWGDTPAKAEHTYHRETITNY